MAANTYRFETIQIRIDQVSYDILYSDQAYFGIKSINTLINKIVSSYAVSYLKHYEQSLTRIGVILSDYLTNSKVIDTLRETLMSEIFTLNQPGRKKEKSVKIHVNARYETDFLYVQNNVSFFGNNIGYAEVIRGILVQYTTFARIQRERILFKSIYDLLSEGILKTRQIELYLTTKQVVLFNPYRMIHPLDEEGNFILGEITFNAPEAIALHKIKKVVILPTTSIFSERTKETYLEMTSTKFNYQFYSKLASDNIIEKVRLLKHLSNSLNTKA